MAVQLPRPLCASCVFCSQRPRGVPARVCLPAEPGRPPSPAGHAPAPLDTRAGFLSLHPAGLGCPGGARGKEPACRCRRCKRLRFDPWVGKTPWRRKWQPTPVFLPGECHGQRSLAGYSPWGRKEPDTLKQLSTQASSVQFKTPGCPWSRGVSESHSVANSRIIQPMEFSRPEYWSG